MKCKVLTLLVFFLALSCSKKRKEVEEPKNIGHPSLRNQVVDVDLPALLKGSLLRIKDGEYVPMGQVEPKEFYVFYETASYCKPCKEFSPTLNLFYEVYKGNYGDKFELAVVSYDINEALFQSYAKKQMPAVPIFSFTEKETFGKKVPTLLGGLIPNLIVTDARGKVLKSSFDSRGRYHGPEIPMNFLKSLLEQK